MFLLGRGSMIDRFARNQAAEAIRHFATGQITNWQFIKQYPTSRKDPAIWALDDTVWCLYDDFRTHTLIGKDALTKEGKKEVARWLTFLYSDEEYLWPRIGRPGLRRDPEPWLLSWLFGFGPGRWKRFKASGDYDVWPFIKREDFDRARKKPVLLVGPHLTKPCS
jgi:hypothetical protein